MKRLAIFLLLSISAFAANGDILAVRIAGDTQRSDASHCTTNGTTTVVCSGGLFTQNDANQKSPIEIPGAGAAAGDYLSTITGFTNATTVTVGSTPGTNVAGVTGTFGITHNSWVAEIDISTDGTHPGTGGTYTTGLSAANDPTNAKVVFTVTSQGYNTSGVLGTNTRTVYCVNPMRQAYPNHAVNDEYIVSTTLTIKCVLSDVIYQADTVTVTTLSGFYSQNATNSSAVTNLAVTNNSTVTYPTSAGCRWAKPGNEAMTSNNYLLEATCFNRHYHAKAPLAAVVFSCTDAHSITASQTVNSMTLSNSGLDSIGNPVQVYAANLDVSTLTQGDVYTCNFKAYPWVGDATSVVDSSTGTQNTENLGPIGGIVDRTGAYGQAHAYVVSTGSDATCTSLVFTTEAAAEASSGFLTIGKAITCAKAFGARTNANDNIFVWVNNSGLAWNTNMPVADFGAQDTWVQVAQSNGGTCGIASGTNAYYNIRLMKVKNCAISGSSTGQFKGNGATNNTSLWLDGNTISASGSPPVYNYQTFWATRNTTTSAANNGWFTHFSTNRLALFARGNVNQMPTMVYADCYVCLGNLNIVAQLLSSATVPTGQSIPNNAVDAYNSRRNFTIAANSAFVYNSGNGVSLLSNVAMIQNIFEKAVGSTPLVSMSADNQNAPTSNILEWFNTFIGERNNGPYNDGGSAAGCNTATAHTLWSKVGNIYSNDNDKADTFTQAGCTAGVNQQSGLRTGGWSVRMGVGRIGDAPVTRTAVSTCDNASDWSIGAAGFQPEFSGIYGLGMASAPTLGFVADRSCGTGTGANTSAATNGTSGGNGDYHLGSTSAFIGIIPCALNPMSFDFDGKARCLLTSATAVGVYAAQQEFQNLSESITGTTKVKGTVNAK